MRYMKLPPNHQFQHAIQQYIHPSELNDLAEQVDNEIAQLIHSKGVLFSTTTVSVEDTIILWVLDKYGEWLTANVGEQKTHWQITRFAEPPRCNIWFARKDHAMMFKMAFGGVAE